MKILFLDCDGTIRQPKSGSTFISSPEDQEIVEGVQEAVATYKNSGYTIIGITNQGGVAAGHKSLESAIKEQQLTLSLIPDLDFIYFAPTYDGLICWRVDRKDETEIRQISVEEFDSFRKPGAGMLNLALKFYGTSPQDCLMVGDRPEDKQAAIAAGVRFMWAQDWNSPPKRETENDYSDLMDVDYPLPDPSWDYSKIYDDCQRSKTELEKLIHYMSQVENATPETDSEVKARLDQIGQRLNQTRRSMDEQ